MRPLLILLLAFIAAFFAAYAGDRPQAGSLLERFRQIAWQAGEVVLRSSAELRESAVEAGGKLAELRAIPADKRSDTYLDDLRNARNEVLAVDAEFSLAQRLESDALQRAAWEAAVAAPKQKDLRGPAAAFAELTGIEVRTAGTQVIDRDEYRTWAESNGEGRMPSFELRTLLDSTTDGGSPGLLRPAGQPIMPRPRQQRLFVRDLISVQQTGLAAVPYIRELNPATNETGATAVAEGVAKPEVVMEWESDTALVVKIAAWIPATMEILQDAPTLRGYIDTRLAYMLKLREEAQILNGPGTSPNMKGILQFAGVQTQGATNNDVPATFANAIGKIENVDGDPDGIAMNPLDFWAQVGTRRSTHFDGDAQGSAPYGAPPVGFWGLPTVRTRALASLSAVVGSWALGATLFDRMQTTIRQSDSHDDYFVNNKVAILAEERVALAVHRPDFFVNTTVDITA